MSKIVVQEISVARRTGRAMTGSHTLGRVSGDAENLGVRIFQELRVKLIGGDLLPNDTLSTRSLAVEYGCSVMPVREALKQLASEGALIGAAKKAYRVPHLSPRQAADLFFIRAVLEGAAAEIAALVLPAAQIAELRQWAERTDAALARRDSVAFLNGNFRFHSSVFRAAANDDLAAMIEALYVRTGPWLAYGITRLAAPEDWQSDHHEIVDALERRDAVAARGLMERDARWGMALYRQQL